MHNYNSKSIYYEFKVVYESILTVQATSIGSTGQIFGTGLGFLIPTLIVDAGLNNLENDVNVTSEESEWNPEIKNQLIILFSSTTGKVCTVLRVLLLDKV